MERDDDTIKGWRRWKHLFTFGSAERIEIEPDDKHTPCTCGHEELGFDTGCFCTFVDVEELDQQ